ncbi:MAG TPA: hypothetical protein VJA19_18500 [Pseudomonas sp.]|nr:hypothetical protein [Pseudomonas sp.]
MSVKILLVEDDRALREALADTLRNVGGALPLIPATSTFVQECGI